MRARLAFDGPILLLAYGLGGGSLLLFGYFLLFGPLGLVALGLSAWAALAFDAALSIVFFLQHSVMVRAFVGRRLGRYRGAVYAIVSGLVLTGVVLLWQPAGDPLLALHGVPRVALRVAFFAPLALAAWAALSIRGFDPFGVLPLVKGRTVEPAPLSARGPYGLVRQPMYLAVLVMLWAHPVWTADRLLLAGLWSAWTIVGAVLEERDLVAAHGDAYRDYQRRVRMFLPRLTGPRSSPSR